MKVFAKLNYRNLRTIITPIPAILSAGVGIFLLSMVSASLVPASAQRLKKDQLLTEIGWLESGIDPTGHLTSEPVTCLLPVTDKQQAHRSEIGAVAYRSPYLFGGLAARKKLSCQACHQNGGANPSFFIAGLSDQPGHIDVTNAVFSKRLEDDIDNPIIIPSLYGLKNRASFGTSVKLPTKEDFVHRVIEDEFDGPKPNQRIFDSLITYINRFDETCPQNEKTIERSVSKDLERITRSVKTAQIEWKGDNHEVAAFLILSARHEIGLIAERYDSSKLKSEQRALVSLSRQLEKIQYILQDPETDKQSNNQSLDSQVKKWLRTYKKTEKKLAKKEQRSLYNVETLKSAYRALP